MEKSKVIYDLFDNPTVEAMLKKMSPEEVEKYKLIGEELYGNIDFTQSKVLNNIPPPMTEALAYITCGLKSGLLPTDLDGEEIALLEECLGKKWYEKFGFSESNLKK